MSPPSLTFWEVLSITDNPTYALRSVGGWITSSDYFPNRRLDLNLTTMVISAVVSVTMTTGQMDYTYQDHNARYQTDRTYILCLQTNQCPPPTPKITAPPPPPIVKKAEEPPPSPTRVAMLAQPKEAQAQTVVTVKEQEISRTVHFAFDSYALREDDKQILSGIRTSASDPASQVKITGYTDRFGPQTYNDRLAHKRAEAVASYLGVTGKAVTDGKGKCCYVDPKRHEMNRRAEVTIKQQVKQQVKDNIIGKETKK